MNRIIVYLLGIICNNTETKMHLFGLAFGFVNLCVQYVVRCHTKLPPRSIRWCDWNIRYCSVTDSLMYSVLLQELGEFYTAHILCGLWCEMKYISWYTHDVVVSVTSSVWEKIELSFPFFSLLLVYNDKFESNTNYNWPLISHLVKIH